MTQHADHHVEWLLTHGHPANLASDPRMPSAEDEPTTLREWAERWCHAQGITAPADIQRRWTSIQRWPQRRKNFPKPRIPRGYYSFEAGAAPAIFSQVELDTWAVTGTKAHRTDEELLSRLASMTADMTLYDIAQVLNLAPATITLARDASLKRIAEGRTGAAEVPDPEQGEHKQRGALYNPRKWAHFWRNRPGTGTPIKGGPRRA